MKKLTIILALIICGCAGNPESAPKSATEEARTNDIEQASSSDAVDSMMIPDNALKSPGGYAYVILKPGNGTKPAHTAAVDVNLRVRSVDGGIVDEGKGTIAAAHSTPFLEEMIGLMEIGETIRVWGESQARIWEIELIGVNDVYNPPEDVGAVPSDAMVLPGFEDVHYRVIEQGDGSSKIQEGQVIRFHATRWKSNGEILESSRAGRGMLLFLNDSQKALDPIHHAMVLQMTTGAHVRLWLPAARIQADSDIVEDFWVAERVFELEPPELKVPEDKAGLTEIAKDVWMRFDARNESPVLLKDSDAAEVDMTCWRAETGDLIEASYIREKHDVMDITQELGIWYDIMKNAAPGDTFVAWIGAKSLPKSVNMDLVCRMKVFGIVNSE